MFWRGFLPILQLTQHSRAEQCSLLSDCVLNRKCIDSENCATGGKTCNCPKLDYFLWNTDSSENARWSCGDLDPYTTDIPIGTTCYITCPAWKDLTLQITWQMVSYCTFSKKITWLCCFIPPTRPTWYAVRLSIMTRTLRQELCLFVKEEIKMNTRRQVDGPSRTLISASCSAAKVSSS